MKKSRESKKKKSSSSRSRSSRSNKTTYTIKTESGKTYKTTVKGWTPKNEKVVSINGKRVSGSSSKTTPASFTTDTKHDEEVKAGDYGISNNKYRNKAYKPINFFETEEYEEVAITDPGEKNKNIFDFKRDRSKDMSIKSKTSYKSKYDVNPFADEKTQFTQIKKEISKASIEHNPELLDLKQLNDEQLRKYIKGDLRLISGGGYTEKGYKDVVNKKTGRLED